jgi:2-(1,2-epoxy-1,2-dihydrophenyl)acetyl-CoA isomerase
VLNAPNSKEEAIVAYNTVLYSVDGGVATVMLNRPEKLNALNDELANEIQVAVREADADDAVRVIVLTGAGKGFCSGLDLTGPRGNNREPSRKDRLDDFGWVGRAPLLLTQIDKPVVAAINGPAAGAGLSLALAADIRLMAAGVRLTTGYIRRGLLPDGGMTFFLPRIIGQARAADLILSARWIEADECERIGLVARMLPVEGFREAVAAYATELAAGPPIGMTYAKRLLWQSTTADLPTMLRAELVDIRACFASQDVQEGIRAFAEKRSAAFTGR